MENALQSLISTLQSHPNIGFLCAFLISLAESLPIIGTIVPGSIAMTAIGAMIGAAVLPGMSTLIWASIGAFIGDYIGYWIGYRYHKELKNIWPFKKYPQWFEQGKNFFHRHGGKSIVIGRFVGPVRSSVPLFAGFLKMSRTRFILAAIPSAALWAIIYMTPGILIGALAQEVPKKEATAFMIAGVVIIVLIWFSFWTLLHFFKRLTKVIDEKISQWWDWLSHHPRGQIITHLIASQKHPQDHHQLTLCLFSLLSGLLFLTLWLSVASHSIITSINLPLFYFFQSLRTPLLDHFFTAITLFGEPLVLAVAGVLVAILLALYRQWRASWHVLLVVLLAFAGVALGKWGINSPRPTGLIEVAKSSSFPSGHMTFSLMILGFLTFLTVHRYQKSWSWALYLATSILILLIGVSRLYLGNHWMTDILGAVFLGFFLLLLVIVSYKRKAGILMEYLTIKKWFGFLLLLLIIPFLFYSHFKFSSILYANQPYFPVIKISTSQWWQQPIKYIPLYRQNRFGRSIEPFNIQWVDSLDNIKKLLKQKDWKPIERSSLTIKNTLQRLVSAKPEYQSPLLKALYHNQKPALVMIKSIANQEAFIEIRLWNSGVTFSNTDLPLWIGTINYHLRNTQSLKPHYQYKTSIRLTSNIGQVIAHNPQYKIKNMTLPKEIHLKTMNKLTWGGQIWLLMNVSKKGLTILAPTTRQRVSQTTIPSLTQPQTSPASFS